MNLIKQTPVIIISINQENYVINTDVPYFPVKSLSRFKSSRLSKTEDVNTFFRQRCSADLQNKLQKKNVLQMCKHKQKNVCQ